MIAGVSRKAVPTLAEPWELCRTPFYVLDRQQLLDNFDRYQRALPEVELYYAVKANPEQAVLSTLATTAVGFEVASVYEGHLLTSIGIAPDRVIFGTAIKPAVDIKEVHEWGVRRFAADSRAELDKLALAAPGAMAYLRVQVDDSDSVFPLGEKFGVAGDRVSDLARQALDLGLELCGLSFHVGSQAMRLSAWAEAIARTARLTRQLRTAGVPITMLNIGGGFPCQYDNDRSVPSIEAIGQSIQQAARLLPDGVQLVAEPGRGLVASAASLVVSVIGRAERGGRTWLFLDAGCYNGLFEAMSYQGQTRYPVVAPTFTQTGDLGYFNLAGPTGDVADVIARNVTLPSGLGEGDRLIFRNVGAYTMSMCVPFNGFPKPDLIVI